ncbi:MAG: C40 family peptidase [Parafilimonas sp.]|nr:C40 family peptidase [Parafilimonas sp.]
MKYILASVVFLASCTQIKRRPAVENHSDSTAATAITKHSFSSIINTDSASPAALVKYSETLIGTPYLYGSANPEQGFDCSGFITYVFNHFNITVPRSSIDFTNVADEVPLQQSKPGDLILFTGTDSTERSVGHMGIIISNDSIQTLFIHSTSGKANGVTITPLNDYYRGRFVKVIRVFSQKKS